MRWFAAIRVLRVKGSEDDAQADLFARRRDALSFSCRVPAARRVFVFSLEIMRIPHLKILGWLWVLFGGFWCALVTFAVLTGQGSIIPEAEAGITYTARAWWEEAIGNTLECSFFLASLLLGVGLLRRWRWAQGGLAILVAVLLAIWAVFIVSPSFPPTTLAQRVLHLSPLLGLALYSLAAVMLPGSPWSLSRRSRILTASGSILGIFAAVGFHLWAFDDVPSNPAEAKAQQEAHENALSQFDYEHIRRAVDSFARDRKARGLALPATVSFQQLASQGYLPSNEVAAFSNADATVSFRAAEGLNVPWIRIRWKDGSGIEIPYVKPAPR